MKINWNFQLGCRRVHWRIVSWTVRTIHYRS